MTISAHQSPMALRNTRRTSRSPTVPKVRLIQIATAPPPEPHRIMGAAMSRQTAQLPRDLLTIPPTPLPCAQGPALRLEQDVVQASQDDGRDQHPGDDVIAHQRITAIATATVTRTAIPPTPAMPLLLSTPTSP